MVEDPREQSIDPGFHIRTGGQNGHVQVRVIRRRLVRT